MTDEQLEKAFQHWDAENDMTHSTLRSAENDVRKALQVAYTSGYQRGWRDGWQSHDTKKSLVDEAA